MSFVLSQAQPGKQKHLHHQLVIILAGLMHMLCSSGCHAVVCCRAAAGIVLRVFGASILNLIWMLALLHIARCTFLFCLATACCGKTSHSAVFT
jgi:hypothetical protein